VAVLDGTLGGGGTVGGDVDNSSGIVAPGNSAGQLTVDGDYTQQSSGTLAIELGGITPGAEHDHLQVTGNAALDGTLSVSLIDGFTPSAGSSFDILDWGTLGGAFSSLNLPTVAGLTWDTSQLYITGELNLTAALLGDYNQNGIVDAADYTVWRDTRGSTTNFAADGDLSGTIDEGDLAVWQANFGATLGTGAVDEANVPEPVGLILSIMGAATGFVLSNRRRSLHAIDNFSR
jgi:hypothetical protein